MRGVPVSGLARLAIIALGTQLSACGYQPRDQVRVRVGSGPEQVQPAGPYAALYLPYAMMTSLAYTPAEQLNADLCPEPALVGRQSDAAAWMRSLQARNWRCVFGLSEMRPCPRRYPNCRPFDGPDLHVWRRNTAPCEVVIAYRGVNLREPGEWPNLRWMFKPPRSGEDTQIEGLLAASGCRAARNAVTAGHSLGGGHAEAAAYANGHIRYAYTFNSVPVIGFIDAQTRHRNRQGLGVDVVHEAGDFLPLLRLLQPASDCNPRVRIVRFNVIPFGLPIIEHNIDAVTRSMAEISRGWHNKPALAYRDAVRCAAS